MYTFVLQPQNIDPQALDLCLERGMFRIGQNMVGCRFVFLSNKLRSAVWLRLPLFGHALQKSLRRLREKNDRKFRIEINKLKIDAKRQTLYERYRTVAQGERPYHLKSVLDIQQGPNYYDSFEVSVWHGDRLVAFSYFDRGQRSIQSLLGVYDPEYHRDSLGIYTMLCEVRYGQAEELSHYYPGYVLPGEPSMDYKLRLRGLEFWNEEEAAWFPHDALNEDWLPTTRLDRALSSAHGILEAEGLQISRHLNPLFEVSAYQTRLRAALPHPEYLRLATTNAQICLVVVWNLYIEMWEIWECRPVTAMAKSSVDETGSRSVELLLRRTKQAQAGSPQDLVHAVKKGLKASDLPF